MILGGGLTTAGKAGTITLLNSLTSTNITASGNISASGNVLSTGVYIPTARFIGSSVLNNSAAISTPTGDSLTNFQIKADQISGQSGFEINANSLLINEITASSHISSSAEMYGNGFHVPISINDGYHIGDGKPILAINGQGGFLSIGAAHSTYNAAGVNIYTTGSDQNAGLFLDSVGNVTSSGNISSSGNYIGNRQFDISNTVNLNTTQGDIIYYGTQGTIAAGDIVYLKTDGSWNKSDADVVGRSQALHGIALGADADVHGILLRGMYTLATDLGNTQAGSPLYLSATEGVLTATAPSGIGQVVRVMGYQLGDDDQIWFAPDNTWVEIA